MTAWAGRRSQGLDYALYEGLEIADSRHRQRTLETYRLPLAVYVLEIEIVPLEHGDPGGHTVLEASGSLRPCRSHQRFGTRCRTRRATDSTKS